MVQSLLTKRERWIFSAVAIFGFLWLTYLFLWQPLVSRNRKLNREISVVKKNIRKYKQLLSQKDVLEKKMKGLGGEDIKTLDLQSDTSLAILSVLEDMAKVSQIQIKEIRPQGYVRTSRLSKEFLIDLRSEGGMEGFVKFIYHMENSAVLLKIKKFRLINKPASSVLEGNFLIAQLPSEE